MITVRELNKSFGSHHVLRNINIDFEEGNVYGIVGENGAGKTTLFRCIAGLEEFEGKIISTYSPLKDYLGLLLTDPFFFSKITGREYLQLLCNARNKKLNEAESQNVFDLPLDQYASTYSTGMKKKLAFTATLLQENKYFILDEPFNGVDIHSKMIITEIIHRLKTAGKTVLISSHIFSTLSENCDMIHLLKEGELVRSVQKNEYASLENEMKQTLIGSKIDKLNIR
jgi:ABC-2 type transport system ATP-binding protein